MFHWNLTEVEISEVFQIYISAMKKKYVIEYSS